MNDCSNGESIFNCQRTYSAGDQDTRNQIVIRDVNFFCNFRKKGEKIEIASQTFGISKIARYQNCKDRKKSAIARTFENCEQTRNLAKKLTSLIVTQ